MSDKGSKEKVGAPLGQGETLTPALRAEVVKVVPEVRRYKAVQEARSRSCDIDPHYVRSRNDSLTYGDSYDAQPHPANMAIGLLIVVGLAGAAVFTGGLATIAHAAIAAPTFVAGLSGVTKAAVMMGGLLGGSYLAGNYCLKVIRYYW